MSSNPERELDIQVAGLLGWEWNADSNTDLSYFHRPNNFAYGAIQNTASGEIFYYDNLPHYSTKLSLLPALLDAIAARKLQSVYLDHLVDIVLPYAHYELESAQIWELVAATPEQHCRAFIAAMKDKTP